MKIYNMKNNFCCVVHAPASGSWERQKFLLSLAPRMREKKGRELDFLGS